MAPTLLLALVALFTGQTPPAPGGPVVLPVQYYEAYEPVAPQTPPPPPLPGPVAYTDVGDLPTVWARAEALAWWVQGAKPPVLVTESPAGTPLARAGVPGSSGTRGILGDVMVNGDVRWGGRFEAGAWLGPKWCDLGVQIGFFSLSDVAETLSAGDRTGTRILGRPFINARTSVPMAEVVSFPRTRAGIVLVHAESSDALGADALVRLPLLCEPCGDGSIRLDYLVGYRFLYLSEGLTIREEVTQLAAPNPGTKITSFDAFRVTNRFNGGSAGAAAFYRRGAFSLEATGRLDVGQVQRDVTIAGATLTATPGRTPASSPGGLLAQVTNIGARGQDGFTLVPEFDVRLGWAVTPWLRLTAGYTFLLYQSVARPGEQVDLQVNTTLLPTSTAARSGVVRPVYPMAQSDLWIQGGSLGIELSW